VRRRVSWVTIIGVVLVMVFAGVALLAALAAAPAASAASSDHGASFAVRCDFSHRLSDDPIVYPGKPGASHSHDFLGNKSANAKSTYQTMLAAPTTCSRPEDTAGYWFPTVSWKDQKGTQTLTAYRTVFYYRAGGKDYRTVKPFAKDLRTIADKDVNGARVRWYCGGGASNDEKAGSADPPTRCSGGVLGLRIIFPDCVAKNSSGGQVTDSTNHRSHMARSKAQSDGPRKCPSTHPIPVPTLTINANFQIPTTSGTVALSSGDASTMHTDFWNTWDQDAPLNLNPPDGRSFGGLNALVKHCINEVPPTSPRPTECRAPTATA
jgi:hypothetical protein